MKKILVYLVISIFAVNVFCNNVAADEFEFDYIVTLQPDGEFVSDYYDNSAQGYKNVKVNFPKCIDRKITMWYNRIMRDAVSVLTTGFSLN